MKTRRTKGLVHNLNKVDFTGLPCFNYTTIIILKSEVTIKK